MKITAQEFIAMPKKAVTLIGMSGAGKSHISCQMEGWGWHNYSCDYEIGSKYLKDELAGYGELTHEDIGALSAYLGKLGAADKGGFALDKFKARQKAYYDAEVASLAAVVGELNAVDGNFIHDSTGSLCEVKDDELMADIGAKTLFVYLKTGEDEDREVLQRAYDYPKPLFFPPDFLAQNLDVYLSEFKIAGIDAIDPDGFSRWIFPRLFEARKPKYQALADEYGVSILSSEFRNLTSQEDFLEIISTYLDKNNER